MGIFDCMRGMAGQRASAAFRNYMDRRGISYRAKSEDRLVVDFTLDNMLRNITFHVHFYGYSVSIVGIIDRMTPKRSRSKVEDYLARLNKRSNGVDFMVDTAGDGVVSLSYVASFEGLHEITDSFIRGCLSTPVKLLKVYGDELYDIIHSEVGNDPGVLQFPSADSTRTLEGELEALLSTPPIAPAHMGEQAGQDQENIKGTTVSEAVGLVKSLLDEKCYEYDLKDGEIPRIDLCFHLEGVIRDFSLSYFFYKDGLLIISAVNNHCVPEKDRCQMAVELNRWNYANISVGCYEMKDDSGVVQYRHFALYDDVVKLKKEVIRKATQRVINAWSDPPTAVLSLLGIDPAKPAK